MARGSWGPCEAGWRQPSQPAVWTSCPGLGPGSLLRPLPCVPLSASPAFAFVSPLFPQLPFTSFTLLSCVSLLPSSTVCNCEIMQKPKCPYLGRWLIKLRYICLMECYAAVKNGQDICGMIVISRIYRRLPTIHYPSCDKEGNIQNYTYIFSFAQQKSRKDNPGTK